jgi:ABC-type Fe3+ transport system substrate-binding protein
MITTVGRLLPACIAVALLTAAVTARAETVEQLYEKAKAEKSLVFYAGGPTAPYEARIKQFQEKFPGIQVSVSGGFSNVLNERIEQQMAAGKLGVDFAFFQTVQDFVNWTKRGKLLAFKPDGFEQIMPNLRDPSGTYMAFAVVAIAYAYNTNLVRAEDLPKSAQDFLKPAFQGKLISVYPHDDDAALYLFHLIVQKYGWSWMDR